MQPPQAGSTPASQELDAPHPGDSKGSPTPPPRAGLRAARESRAGAGAISRPAPDPAGKTLGSGPGEAAAPAGDSAAQAAEPDCGVEARARIGEDVEFAGGDGRDLCACLPSHSPGAGPALAHMAATTFAPGFSEHSTEPCHRYLKTYLHGAAMQRLRCAPACRPAADEADSQDGRRPVRAETLAFRRAFLAAAAAAAGAARPEALAEGDQRTAAWLALRETRLTASAFGNALGCASLSLFVKAACKPHRLWCSVWLTKPSEMPL